GPGETNNPIANDRHCEIRSGAVLLRSLVPELLNLVEHAELKLLLNKRLTPSSQQAVMDDVDMRLWKFIGSQPFDDVNIHRREKGALNRLRLQEPYDLLSPLPLY